MSTLDKKLIQVVMCVYHLFMGIREVIFSRFQENSTKTIKRLFLLNHALAVFRFEYTIHRRIQTY